MNWCRNCGIENADGLSFCSECGTKLTSGPQMVVPLDSLNQSNLPVTEAFTEKESFVTKVGSRFQADESVPTLSSLEPPQGTNKTIFWVFGGCFTLLLIAIVGIAGIMIVRTQSREGFASNPTPVPTPFKTIEEEPPTPEPSLTPIATPEVEPEEKEPNETPLETPENDREPELDDPDSEPVVTFTPAEKPTRQGSYRVKPDDGWQVSEINTVPSEIFRTNIRGKIFMDGIKKSVSPKGVSSNRNRRIYKQFRTGALLMRTRFPNGKVGNIMPATKYNEWENFPNEGGRLEFVVNDNAPENNKGTFIISVKMMSVPE